MGKTNKRNEEDKFSKDRKKNKTKSKSKQNKFQNNANNFDLSYWEDYHDSENQPEKD